MTPESKNRSLAGDLAIVVGVSASAALLLGSLDVTEALFEQTRQWERFQLDEAPLALLVLALCLVWFSWRRYQEARAQLGARTAAEKQLAQALAQNRELARQHQTLQENERKHLARELHDELSQYLNAIKLDAVAIRDREIGDHDAATSASMGIIRSVDHVHGVVGDLIRRLRPTGLDELGLEAAVENCIDHWRRRTPQTEYTLRTSGELKGVCEPVSLALYRLIQEGLTNVYKHADARRVDIMLEGPGSGAEREAYVALTVSDDGQGADLGDCSGGFGLIGMRERVAMMGGTFEMNSRPGNGFRFSARTPASGAAT